MPQKRITIVKDGCCFFRTTGHFLCGKESAAGEKVQIHDIVRQRIKQLWTRNYKPAVKWEEMFEKSRPFPMKKDQWNAIFLDAKGWATIPVIMMAATLLNCRFITYTPVNPVEMGKKAAPDAVWEWKVTSPSESIVEHKEVCSGAIYLYNEDDVHYIPIYVLESPSQRLSRHDKEFRKLQKSHTALTVQLYAMKRESTTLKAEVSALKGEIASIKAKEQVVQPRPIEGVETPQRAPPKKRVKLSSGAVASGQGAAAETLSCPPARKRKSPITAAFTALRAEFEQLKELLRPAVTKGEVFRLIF